MDKADELTQITDADLDFLKQVFSRVNGALTLQELTEKLAFQKTSSQLKQKVKIYDPDCSYEIGDLIYKEYDEPLMVSSKGAEHFKGSVVLKVVDKTAYESYNCEMLEVAYSGGGTFRKHVDFMAKTHTKVLLPSNCNNKGGVPAFLVKDEDPRLDEVPMTDRDLKKLEKNLNKVLSGSEHFFQWNGLWQLSEKRIEIPEEKIEEIKNYFRETGQSASTAELCEKFLGQDPKSDLFALHCLSLNYTLNTAYKQVFAFVSPVGWGKWHLKEVLDARQKKLPLSAPMAKLPPLEKEASPGTFTPAKFPLKVYLTWREILSGGIQVPRPYRRPFSVCREYVFIDIEEEKDYLVYFYPSPGIFLGLEAFYKAQNVPQGASLTLELKETGRVHFWLKKSKKKLAVPRIVYDPKSDRFSEAGEERYTYSLPNKIIHLERDTLRKLFSLYDQRNKLDLRELLILVFNHFGLEGEALFLHYMRAYHLVDVLRHTSQEDVEKTLLRSPEFASSEKKKGIFLYTEKVKAEPEIPSEEPEAPPMEEAPREEIEAPGTPHLAIGTIEEEVSLPEPEEEIIVVEEPEPVPEEPEKVEEPPEPSPLPPRKKEEAPGKEPSPKKKKKERRKPLGEAEPRRRKGEKKIIEERIEIEESEMEALIAIKAKEKEEEAERAAAAEKKKKEEYKEFVEAEEPKFGIFAEKLKTALGKTKKTEDKETAEKKGGAGKKGKK